MELETDFLSCSLAGSAPKSDLKDNQKIDLKEKVLSNFVSQLYGKLTSSTQEAFCLPLDDMNVFTLSFKSICPSQQQHIPKDITFHNP